MGTLRHFRRYLDDRLQVLRQTEALLVEQQSKYETFFAEVNRIREQELEQLTQHITADRSALPKSVNQALDDAQAKAAQEFADQLGELEQKQQSLIERTEKTRRRSVLEEAKVHKKNVVLDQREELLKEHSAKLLTEITDYNTRISQMGRGFGFFKNFFSMRKLQQQRQHLTQEQEDLAARIDNLRARWKQEESEYVRSEQKLRGRWVDLTTEAAAIGTKIEHLQNAGSRIIQRSAVETVLFAKKPKVAPVKADDPKCPRCQQANPESYHFCRICAQRLVADKPDFAGSLLEIAELNSHFEFFSNGMQACQEIIGLVRGLKSGIKNFSQSVDDMLDTQNTYPIATLQIDVPTKSVEYGRSFDGLKKWAQGKQQLHPNEFARQIRQWIDENFDEGKIKDYFETMGQELSRQADRQW